MVYTFNQQGVNLELFNNMSTYYASCGFMICQDNYFMEAMSNLVNALTKLTESLGNLCQTQKTYVEEMGKAKQPSSTALLAQRVALRGCSGYSC